MENGNPLGATRVPTGNTRVKPLCIHSQFVAKGRKFVKGKNVHLKTKFEAKDVIKQYFKCKKRNKLGFSKRKKKTVRCTHHGNLRPC